MEYKRIIPCLDIQGGRVVKGIRFASLRDAGDPVEAAEQYSKAGADELVFLDISATGEGSARKVKPEGPKEVRQLAERGDHVIIYDMAPLSGPAAWWLKDHMNRVQFVQGAVDLWPQVVSTILDIKPDIDLVDQFDGESGQFGHQHVAAGLVIFLVVGPAVAVGVGE